MQRRFRRILACVALVASISVAWRVWLQPVDPRSGPSPMAMGDGWLRSTPAAEGFNGPALRRATERVLDGPFNVHSVLIERHGRLLAEWYQGGPDRSVYSLVSTRHRVGPNALHDVRSVGKSVTGLLYGIALAQGRVPAPDAPLSAAFPALDGAAATNAQRIRIRDLLDMSSGLSWQEDEPGINDELRLFWTRDLPPYVLGRPMTATPGTTFNYNGGGTALLAQIISEGVHAPLDVFAQRQLFAPMGIRSWQWTGDVHGRPMAFNGLRLKPRDLLKIGRLVLDDGQWNGHQLVPASWVRASWTPGLSTGVADFHYRGQWWSGTVAWHGRRLPWHAAFGNGGQRLFVVPDLDLAMVTTAGAYDALPTAIAVNTLLQDVVSSVER